MIYLDSSALVKLVFDEQESAALEAWLAVRHGVPLVSSELAKVEVIRSCRRVDAGALPAARTLLTGLDLIPLNGVVLDEAAEVGGTSLRSLDAVHLASALAVGDDLVAFAAYDLRLAGAAADLGLELARPGT